VVPAGKGRAARRIHRHTYLVDRRRPGHGPVREPVCHLDTQTARGDIGWISYSTNQGRTWSAPLRVTRDHDNALHNVEVTGAGPGVADVAWQADNSPRGYATYLRPFSITRGWLAPAIRVSSQFGNKKIWPGDTFGLSILPGGHGRLGSGRVALSWGSAVGSHKDSEIYARQVRLPHPHSR
jgi:hypothetical protein